MPSEPTSTTAIRCLSVKQPFAQAICLGLKKVENRNWRTDYRGLLFIHASKAKDCLDVTDLCGTPLPDDPWTYPRGAVVGFVEMWECANVTFEPQYLRNRSGRRRVQTMKYVHMPEGHPAFNDDALKKTILDAIIPDDMAQGEFCFLFKHAHLLDEPIPYSGKTGLFPADAILAQLSLPKGLDIRNILPYTKK